MYNIYLALKIFFITNLNWYTFTFVRWFKDYEKKIVFHANDKQQTAMLPQKQQKQQKMKNLSYKKSELSQLANLVKEDVFESFLTGEIEVSVSFPVKGENTRLTLSKEMNNPVNVQDLMVLFRKKLSNILYLKVNKMNLEIRINDNKVDPNLFGLNTVFTGKKINRYRVFNSWFIVAIASHLGIEANPTGNEC
jgi:hypothetical protein